MGPPHGPIDDLAFGHFGLEAFKLDFDRADSAANADLRLRETSRGMPPLGYDVENRKLAIKVAEARTVVDISRRYLALRSVHALRDELAGAGITAAPHSARRHRIWGPEALSGRAALENDEITSSWHLRSLESE